VTITFVSRLQSTLSSLWSIMRVLDLSQQGHYWNTLSNGFPHETGAPPSNSTGSHSCYDHMNNETKLLVSCTLRSMARTISAMYAILLLPQNATWKCKKHFRRNSVSHGLYTILLVAVFIVYRILLFGLGSSTKLQSNSVPCTLKTNRFDVRRLTGDFRGASVSTQLT
jgi:hypothetical protein